MQLRPSRVLPEKDSVGQEADETNKASERNANDDLVFLRDMQMLSAVTTFCFCINHRVTSSGIHRPECVLTAEYIKACLFNKENSFISLNYFFFQTIFARFSEDLMTLTVSKIRIN